MTDFHDFDRGRALHRCAASIVRPESSTLSLYGVLSELQFEDKISRQFWWSRKHKNFTLWSCLPQDVNFLGICQAHASQCFIEFDRKIQKTCANNVWLTWPFQSQYISRWFRWMCVRSETLNDLQEFLTWSTPSNQDMQELGIRSRWKASIQQYNRRPLLQERFRRWSESN